MPPGSSLGRKLFPTSFLPLEYRRLCLKSQVARGITAGSAAAPKAANGVSLPLKKQGSILITALDVGTTSN